VQDCRELGYIKSQLLCSSCDNLKEFGLEEIREQCKECCQKESGSSAGKKYAKAVLEVCTCKFGAYPQVQIFWIKFTEILLKIIFEISDSSLHQVRASK
jgi:hypothetical protein